MAKGPVAEQPATGASTETTPLRNSQPAEPKADSTTADQTVAKATEQAPPVAAPPAPAARKEEPQLPKIDPDEAKSLAKDKDSAQVAQLKPGLAGGEEINRKEATIREEDNIRSSFKLFKL